jgi:RNA polymerase sigma factor (sigma-70 family)
VPSDVTDTVGSSPGDRLSAIPSTAQAPEADLTRALYERYAGQIFRYCRHQLGSREEAEDAVQSTFLNAFRGIKRGIVPESDSAWLFTIAHNVCLTRRRSSWRRGRVESPADFEIVEEIAPAPTRRPDDLIGLEDVLARMPEQQRRAILLREWQGLSYREIGEELELSPAAVETLIFRARRSLASGLEAPAAPRRHRRFASGALGSLVTAAQSFLAGGGAVKIAAVVAVAGAGGVVATAPVHDRHAPPPAPKQRVVAHIRPHVAPARSVVAPVVPAPPPRHHRRRHATATRPQHARRTPPGLVKKQVAPERPPARHVPPGQAKKAAAPAAPVTVAAPKSHGRASAPGQRKKQAVPLQAPAAAPVEHGNGLAKGHTK